MNIQSEYFPENWEPNNKEAINQWMNNLPTVYDISKAEKADQTYRELIVLDSLKKERQ